MLQGLFGIAQREIPRFQRVAMSPVVNMMRNSAFAKTEAAGVDLSGSWDQQVLRANDVDAFQDSSKIHTFIDNYQSKGSHVVDTDGNVLLDLCSTETLPLGHNADVFTKVSLMDLTHKHLSCRVLLARSSMMQLLSTETLTLLRELVPMLARSLSKLPD